MWTEISSSMSAINVQESLYSILENLICLKIFNSTYFFFDVKRIYCNLKLYLKAYKLNLVWENFEQGKIFY